MPVDFDVALTCCGTSPAFVLGLIKATEPTQGCINLANAMLCTHLGNAMLCTHALVQLYMAGLTARLPAAARQHCIGLMTATLSQLCCGLVRSQCYA